MIALIVIGALIVGGGIMGFDLIMRMQAIITVVTGVLTVFFIVLMLHHIIAVAGLITITAKNVIKCT